MAYLPLGVQGWQSVVDSLYRILPCIFSFLPFLILFIFYLFLLISIFFLKTREACASPLRALFLLAAISDSRQEEQPCPNVLRWDGCG